MEGVNLTYPILTATISLVFSAIIFGVKLGNVRTELERQIMKNGSDALATASLAQATDRQVVAVRSMAEMKIAGCERRCAELSEKLAEHKLAIAERLANYPTKTEMREMMDDAMGPLAMRIASMESILQRAFNPEFGKINRG